LEVKPQKQKSGGKGTLGKSSDEQGKRGPPLKLNYLENGDTVLKIRGGRPEGIVCREKKRNWGTDPLKCCKPLEGPEKNDKEKKED